MANDQVLLVLMEDASVHSFGAYGPTKSNVNPGGAIDRIFRNGTRFHRAYCPASVCGPSRANLFFASRPDVTGIYGNPDDWRTYWRQGHKTAIEHFRDQGWKVWAVGKVFHGKHDAPAWFYDRQSDPSASNRKTKIELQKRGGNGSPLKVGINRIRPIQDNSALAANQSIRYIKNSSRSRKNFFIHGDKTPHLPMLVPESNRYISAFARNRVRMWNGKAPSWSPFYGVEKRLGDREKKLVRARHLGCVRYGCDESARVIQAFRKKYPNGTVVFTTDHGYATGESGHWRKASTLQAAVQVPLYMLSPHLTRGWVSGAFSTAEIFPLLFDLMGVPPLPGAHHQSRKNEVLALRMDSLATVWGGSPNVRSATNGVHVLHQINGQEFWTDAMDRPAAAPENASEFRTSLLPQ